MQIPTYKKIKDEKDNAVAWAIEENKEDQQMEYDYYLEREKSECQ